mgnify:CR=1 FL=1
MVEVRWLLLLKSVHAVPSLILRMMFGGDDG